MSAPQSSEKVTVYAEITAAIDRTDPGDPNVHLEAGCNEFWLNVDEARALLGYLQRTLPILEAVHD